MAFMLKKSREGRHKLLLRFYAGRQGDLRSMVLRLCPTAFAAVGQTMPALAGLTESKSSIRHHTYEKQY